MSIDQYTALEASKKIIQYQMIRLIVCSTTVGVLGLIGAVTYCHIPVPVEKTKEIQLACIAQHGDWHSNDASCTFPNPKQMELQQQCTSQHGRWDGDDKACHF